MEVTRRGAPLVLDSYCSSLAPSFRFAWRNPRWCDKELRVIVRSESLQHVPVREASWGDGVVTKAEDEEMACERGFDDENIGNTDRGEGPSGSNVEIMKMPVNSVILAKESHYFRTLFEGNGFRESKADCVDVIITPQEKTSFQNLIEFMYTTNVSSTEAEGLIALWGISERFLVRSCSQLCTQRLKDMSLDVAQSVQIIEAASTCYPSGELRTLVDATTGFLLRHFNRLEFVKPIHSDTTDRNKELLRDFGSLPQSALRAILANDHLQVEREEIAFYAVTLWLKHNSSKLSESQEMMADLAPLIRFPFMKTDVLTRLLDYPELARASSQQLIMEALKFRSATGNAVKLKSELEGGGHSRFCRRTGYLRPIKCMVLEQLPRKQAVIHFNASLEELESVDPNVQLNYERFRVADTCFAFQLHAADSLKAAASAPTTQVGIDLRMYASTASPVQVELSLSVWSVPLMAFSPRFHSIHTFQGESCVLRCVDLFGQDFRKMHTQKNLWVCQGKVFLKAEISIRS